MPRAAYHWGAGLLWLVALSAMASAEANSEDADRLFAARKYEQAIAAYEQTLPQRQGEAAAKTQLQIALSRRYLGRHAQAIDDFNAALAGDQLPSPLRAKARLEKGYCLYLTRQYDAALGEFNAVMADAQAHPTTRQEAGMYGGYLLNKLKRHEEAIAMFEFAAGQESTLPAARAAAILLVGDTHRLMRHHDEARRQYQRAGAVSGDTGAIAVKVQTRLQELDAILAGDQPFYIRPYVTRVSHEQADLLWVSKGPATAAQVLLSGLEGQPLRTFAVEQRSLAEGGFLRQHATLTALSPATRYRYIAQAGDAQQQGTFLTPPPPGVDAGPIRFCVLGDTQTNAVAHAAVAPGLACHQPQFVVHCGDFVESGARWLEWKSQFFDPGHSYLSEAAFWPTRGNHDGGPYYPTLFGLEEKQFYSFDFGPIHFVVLDSFGPHASVKGRAQQAQWLKQDLADTRAKWIFAAVHDPMVNHDYDNRWWGYDEILPIVQSHGVDIVFSGHHHLYRRFLPIQLDQHKPVLHVTTGGSGGSLSGGHVSPLAVALAETHHHLNLTIDNDTLTMQSVDTQGNVLDELTLIKRQGRYQDEVMDQAVPLPLARQVAALLHHFLQTHTDNVVLAQFDSPVQSGAAVAFSFDTSRLASGRLNMQDFPPDTRIVISQAPSSPWTVARQEATLSDGTLRFKAQAPAHLALSTNGEPLPPLEIMMNVRVGERLLVPHRVTVRAAPKP